MLLAADIGNSDITLGFYDKNTWLFEYRIATQPLRNVPTYAHLLRDFMLENDIKTDKIQEVIVSSVVPTHTEAVSEAMKLLFDFVPWVMGADLYAKLPIPILNPYEIGADLVANVMAAHRIYPKNNVLVIDFGTALTFTLLSDEGQILGVNIAPGLKTAMYSLFQKTAQLPEVPLQFPPSILGATTETALQGGVLWGYVGLVEGMVKRIKTQLQLSDCKVIATGGLVEVLYPLHALYDQMNRFHTLEGLRYVVDVLKDSKS
ncbi:MAG: type III pantothenate kinase [Cytophagales bacterium]|nr:MAG: type III pantothenate kinase [Cytophagales bacterium]